MVRMPFLLFAGGISILFFACAQFSGKHSLPVHYLILGGVSELYTCFCIYGQLKSVSSNIFRPWSAAIYQ